MGINIASQTPTPAPHPQPMELPPLKSSLRAPEVSEAVRGEYPVTFQSEWSYGGSCHLVLTSLADASWQSQAKRSDQCGAGGLSQ